MIIENLIFTIIIGVSAVAALVAGFLCGPQKAAVNLTTALIGIFLVGWLTLLLIIDAAVLPSMFTYAIVIFVVASMYQTLVCTFQPSHGIANVGTAMSVAGFVLFALAPTQEYALGAMIASFFTLFGACAMAVLFGHKMSMVAPLVPLPFLLGGSSIAVALYLSFVGSELTVLVSLLLLGGLLSVQAFTGLLAGWNCDVVNMSAETLVQTLFSDNKRRRPRRSNPYQSEY